MNSVVAFSPRLAPSGRSGFTLLELLVVMAVIVILASMSLPGLARAKESARRAQCIGNLRQLAQASLSYADDDSRGSLSGRTEAGDQSLGYLLDHVGSVRLFVCPSTRGVPSTGRQSNPYTGVSEPLGLQFLANRRDARDGLRYMCHAFIGHNTPYSCEVSQGQAGMRILPYLRKDLSNINSYEKYHDTFGLRGTKPGPSGFWLVVDNYWTGATLAYPDVEDNHGDRGVNVSFCDGHVEWLPRGRFLLAYERDTDEGRQGIALPY